MGGDNLIPSTNYNGLEGIADKSIGHVGGNMRAGDPYTHSPRVWRYAIERFGISSVLDIGSGRGHAGLFFHRQQMRVICVDALEANIETALFPTVFHDLTAGPVRTKVDLVHCQEVVEHIDKKFVDNVIDSFLCGNFAIFTHAVPRQGGYHHVNLQPPDYWIDKMRGRDCLLLEEDTRRIRELASQDGASYLAATGLVFENPRHSNRRADATSPDD